MSNNVSYSFISSDSDNLTFRSTVNSFGLDHVIKIAQTKLVLYII